MTPRMLRAVTTTSDAATSGVALHPCCLRSTPPCRGGRRSCLTGGNYVANSEPQTRQWTWLVESSGTLSGSFG